MRSWMTGYYYHRDIGTRQTTAFVGPRIWCEDYVGNYKGINPFKKTEWMNHTAYLDGQLVDEKGELVKGFYEYPVDFQCDPDNSRYALGPISYQDKVRYAWELAAKTNPSRNYMSMYTQMGELREMPSLVRNFGRSWLTAIAGGYISWRWAIKPLLRELDKIEFIQAQIQQRLNWIEALSKGKSIRTRAHLMSRELMGEPRVINLQSNIGSVRAERRVTFTDKVWGSCSWKLYESWQAPKLPGERRKLAEHLTMGLTGYDSLCAAWELLPWSWLADWFAPVGDAIAAQNNTIPVTPTRMCLMRTTTSKSSYRIVSQDPWIKVHAMSPVWGEGEVVKTRESIVDYAHDLPVPMLHLLNEKQWMILGALAALKFDARRLKSPPDVNPGAFRTWDGTVLDYSRKAGLESPWLGKQSFTKTKIDAMGSYTTWGDVLDILGDM